MPSKEYHPVVSLRVSQRDALKRLAAILSPRLGKPASYGEAIVEAERICRDALNGKLPESEDSAAA